MTVEQVDYLRQFPGLKALRKSLSISELLAQGTVTAGFIPNMRKTRFSKASPLSDHSFILPGYDGNLCHSSGWLYASLSPWMPKFTSGIVKVGLEVDKMVFLEVSARVLSFPKLVIILPVFHICLLLVVV
jgi:hypothetical protein